MTNRTVLKLSNTGWRIWLDETALWETDQLFLPGAFEIARLAYNPPTGGWQTLDQAAAEGESKNVSLPTTVEAHYWKKNGPKPLTVNEYVFSQVDPLEENGIYRGVSWWWLDFDGSSLVGRDNVRLRIPAARQRIEVFLNQALVGYDVIAETPYEMQVASALKPGLNRLAIRVTNPGGRYDWTDFYFESEWDTARQGAIPPLRWGDQILPTSHGFGGLDSDLTLTATDQIWIDDIFLRNTPQVTDAFVEVAVRNQSERTIGKLTVEVRELGKHQLAWSRTLHRIDIPAGTSTVSCSISVPKAKPWSPESPQLYECKVRLETVDQVDELVERFGFRWFTVTGLGAKAVWRLNNRRFKILSAISWNWWATNGLFPEEAHLTREIEAAKALGLNTLTCHRNIANERSLGASDEAGILRWEEPGAGRAAWGPDEFSAQYMTEKIRRMVMRDRNHPSLVIFGLQNEQVPESPMYPKLKQTMDMVRECDPTRVVVLKSGFSCEELDLSDATPGWESFTNKQAFYLPGDDLYHFDDGSGQSGWWDSHTVGGPGVYQDWMYQGPTDFSHISQRKEDIVFWGEALGSGSADALGDIRRHYIANPEETSFHKEFHLALADAYDRFLDDFEFRESIKSIDALCRTIGNRSYEFWGRLIENVRIADNVDGIAISGWESGVIDQHCGLVDVFRNFKGDPDLISYYCRPLHLAIKPRKIVHALGASPIVDVHVANSNGLTFDADLDLLLIDPDGVRSELGKWKRSIDGCDTLSQLLVDGVSLPPLTKAGEYQLSGRLEAGSFSVTGVERILCLALSVSQALCIHVDEEGENLSRTLEAMGHRVVDQVAAIDTAAVTLFAAYGDSTVSIPREHLVAAESGGTLFLIADGAGVAERWAGQLSREEIAPFDSMVGPAMSSWSGSWYLTKKHPILDGLPQGEAMGRVFQADPRGTGAWFNNESHAFFGDGVVWASGHGAETIVAYGKDHSPKFGSAFSIIPFGEGEVILSTLAGLYSSIEESSVASLQKSADVTKGPQIKGYSAFNPLAALKIISNVLSFVASKQRGLKGT